MLARTISCIELPGTGPATPKPARSFGKLLAEFHQPSSGRTSAWRWTGCEIRDALGQFWWRTSPATALPPDQQDHRDRRHRQATAAPAKAQCQRHRDDAGRRRRHATAGPAGPTGPAAPCPPAQPAEPPSRQHGTAPSTSPAIAGRGLQVGRTRTMSPCLRASSSLLLARRRCSLSLSSSSLRAHGVAPNGLARAASTRPRSQTASMTGAASASRARPPSVSAGAPTNDTISCGIARLIAPKRQIVDQRRR